MPKSSVYWHYDAAGRLLYVGMSGTHMSRLHAHKSSSPWYYEVARIELEHFETKDEALRVESLAIFSEKPIYNKVHNVGKNAGAFDAIAAAIDGAQKSLPEDQFNHACATVERLMGADPRCIRQLDQLASGDRCGPIELFDLTEK